MSMALHILADCQIVISCMWTPPSHYFLESSAQAAYMETHPS